MITQSLRCLRDDNEMIHPCLTGNTSPAMPSSVWRPRGIFFPVALSRAL